MIEKNRQEKKEDFSMDEYGRLVITDESLLQEISGGKEGSLVYKGTKTQGSSKFNAVCGGGGGDSGNKSCGGGNAVCGVNVPC